MALCYFVEKNVMYMYISAAVAAVEMPSFYWEGHCYYGIYA